MNTHNMSNYRIPPTSWWGRGRLSSLIRRVGGQSPFNFPLLRKYGRKRISSILTINCLTFIILFIGCDDTPTEVDNYQYEPVLSAFLNSGKTITEVDTVAFLERVQPLFDVYDFQEAAISCDSMKLIDIEALDSIYLEDHQESPGKYTPVSGSSMSIQGKHHYKIIAYTPAPHNERIWAETVIPDTFPANSVKTYLMDNDGNKFPVSDGEILSRYRDKYLFFEWPSVDSAGGYFGSGTSLEPINNLVGLDPDWEAEPLPWELVDSLDGNELGIDEIQAVAYIDERFYFAGKLNNINKVFQVDRGGNTIENSFDQFGNSADGMQDLAWDGELLWGAEDSTVYGFTTNGTLRERFNVYQDSLSYAAWDPDSSFLWLCSKSGNFCHLKRNNTLQEYDLEINVSGISYWRNELDEIFLYFIHISDDGKPFIIKTYPISYTTRTFNDTMLVQDLSLLGEDWADKHLSSAFLTDDIDLEYRYFLTVSKMENRVYILRPGVQEEFFADVGRAGWIIMREDQNVVSLPWVIFGFAGPHRLNLNAISPGYYDYLFSSMRVQQGMLQKPLSNIHGGLGIFAGIAEESIDIILVPNE